jgi:4-amino-4-deoxy-L-arabinose transferase-like glycosyltransferase
LEIKWHSLSFYGFVLSFSFLGVVLFYLTHGTYLDSFLLADKNDSFMDFFNVMYDSVLSNPYSSGTIYPPFCYIIMRFFSHFVPLADLDGGGGAIAASQAGKMIYIIFIAVLLLLCLVIALRHKRGPRWERGIFVITILVSMPFLFEIERGNIIVIALAGMLVFIQFYDSPNKILRELALLCLAISVNIKLYPVLFGLILLREKRFYEAIRCASYGLILFIVPFAGFGGFDQIPIYFNNVFSETTNFLDIVGFTWTTGFSCLLSELRAVITGESVHLDQTSVYIGYIMGLLCIVAAFLFSEKWKSVLAITVAMCGMFTMNFSYTLVMLLPALLLFLNKDLCFTKKNLLYTILITALFILVPFDISMFFDTLIPHQNVPEWRPFTAVTLVEQIALFVLALLLIADGFLGLHKKCLQRVAVTDAAAQDSQDANKEKPTNCSNLQAHQIFPTENEINKGFWRQTKIGAAVESVLYSQTSIGKKTRVAFWIGICCSLGLLMVLADNMVSKLLIGFVVVCAVYCLIFIAGSKLLLKTRQATIFVVDKLRSQHFIGVALTVVPVLLVALFFFDKSFPLTEGWYSVYAQLVNSGAKPYVDFDFHFPPVYLYMISFFTKIFGYELIALRILGVLVYTATAIVVYLIMSRLFKTAIAVICAVVAMTFVQAQSAYIYYDYICFYDLFTYLTVFALLLFIDRASESKHRLPRLLIPAMCAGLFSVLAAMIRQSSGIIVMAGIVIFFIIIALTLKSKRQYRLGLFVYLVSALVALGAVFLPLLINGSFNEFYISVIREAIAAKGGINVVIFAWMGRYINSLVQSLPLILFFGLIISILLFAHYSSSKNKTSKKRDFLSAILFCILLTVGLVLSYHSDSLNHFFQISRNDVFIDTVFTASIFVFCYTLIRIILCRNSVQGFHIGVALVSGCAVALGFGAGTSGGLSFGQTALAAALAIGMLIYHANQIDGGILAAIPKMISVSLALSLALGLVGLKIGSTYHWWGLETGAVYEQTERLDLPYLENLKVTEQDKQSIEGIVDNIWQYSVSENDVFIFPHVPVIYLASGKVPPTKTVVQWFDVSSPAAIDSDIETLLNHPPNVIVLCNLPEKVKNSHESLFNNGEESGLTKMERELYAMVRNGSYRVVGSYDFNVGYKIAVFAKKQ